ncbi:hypothetical protein LguiA_027162 [Lonicera macranthoides]
MHITCCLSQRHMMKNDAFSIRTLGNYATSHYQLPLGVSLKQKQRNSNYCFPALAWDELVVVLYYAFSCS